MKNCTKSDCSENGFCAFDDVFDEKASQKPLNKFSIPEIIEFTYLAKKKKSVKIDYHKDIRDIIKDIYKHV